MNIAVFVKRTTFHEGYGGMETQCKMLCEGLAGRGHKITVFSPDWGLKLDAATDSNVLYIFVKCVYRMGPVLGFFGNLQKSNWLNRSFEEFHKIHKVNKFDLVLAQSSTGLGIIKRKQIHKVPIVSIAHGSIIGEYRTFLMSMTFPKDFGLFLKNTGFTLKNFFRRQRDFVNGSSKVIAVSDYVRQALLDETFTDEARIEVINNGIDPKPFFKKNEKINRGKKLLYVGQVIKSKGIEEIIEIFDDARFADHEVDIVGSGDLISEFESKPECKNNIHFKGKVKYEDLVTKYYKNFDYGVFIFPTKRNEGQPMVLVEALFSGLPVVAYSNGGVPSAVKDNETGFLVKDSDLEAFKEKLLDVLNDDTKRDTFADNALMFAYENFTLEEMLNKYEDVFKKVIK